MISAHPYFACLLSLGLGAILGFAGFCFFLISGAARERQHDAEFGPGY